MININDCFLAKCKDKKGESLSKVKGYSFFNKELNRQLILHTDVDNKEYSALSDKLTGLRFFTLPHAFSKLDVSIVESELQKFIKHYTIDLIKTELKKKEEVK